jgi:carbonic anhydrase/acetyltransferase-like protein (isoleucine patch superfamily)
MKYKLTKNTKEVYGITLYQIQALKDFENVKEGDLGGWIEKKENLSQENNCWVYGDAWVSDNARVYGDAWVSDNAWVYDDAKVCGNARVYGNAWVSDNARVYDNARVSDDAWVSDNARVYGNAWVSDNAADKPKEEIKSEYICEDDFQI